MPDSVSARTALVLFCRRPSPGSGKQRLVRHLGETHALAVACALLECALEDLAAWPGRLILSPARPEDGPWAEDLLPCAKWVIPQPEGNLGQRINAVDAELRRRGCERILIIGSDSPSMQSEDLEEAAVTLDRTDIVLVPAADGGVTLMGSRAGWPSLADLPWSESGLGVALDRCCRGAGMTVERLAASYDIDEVSDFRLALAALARDARPARRRLNALLTALAGLAEDPARPTAAIARVSP